MEKILKGEKLEKLEIPPAAPIKLPDALQAPKLNPSATTTDGPPTAAD